MIPSLGDEGIAHSCICNPIIKNLGGRSGIEDENWGFQICGSPK